MPRVPATVRAWLDSGVLDLNLGHWPPIFNCGTWRVQMWDMERSNVGRDLDICGTWLMHMCETRAICVTWHFQMWDMTQSNARLDSGIYVCYGSRWPHPPPPPLASICSNVSRDVFRFVTRSIVCVTWRIYRQVICLHMCTYDMTHLYI